MKEWKVPSKSCLWSPALQALPLPMMSLLGTLEDHIHLTFFFSQSTAFKLFLKPLQNGFAQIKPEWPLSPHPYHFFPFYLAETSKPSGLKTLYKFKMCFLMHLAGRNHSTTMLGHYCIFTCLLNIFPSPLMRFTAPLPHFWGVGISHTARSMGPSLTPVLHDIVIACALHIFSIFLFSQCPGYLTQTRSSQPRGSGDNSFQSLLPLIHLLVTFLTGHKTLFSHHGANQGHAGL